jgi:hypothetical protein
MSELRGKIREFRRETYYEKEDSFIEGASGRLRDR